MATSKRITIATILGLVVGIICWLGGKFVIGNEYTGWMIINILAHRTVMSFAIGISSLRINWAVHGLLIGLIVGSLFSLYDYLMGYGVAIALILMIVNPIYGLIIEYVTTKVFNSPVK